MRLKPQVQEQYGEKKKKAGQADMTGDTVDSFWNDCSLGPTNLLLKPKPSAACVGSLTFVLYESALLVISHPTTGGCSTQFTQISLSLEISRQKSEAQVNLCCHFEL